MCEHFGVTSTSDLLMLEALLMFHGLVSIMGYNWKGSQPGKGGNIDRGREAALHQLVTDYFLGDNSTFTDVQFRRHFRMARPLFLRIVDAISEEDAFFQQRPDAAGKFGATPLQKAPTNSKSRFVWVSQQ